MTSLPYPDQFYLNAALGWLMFDNTEEAAAEFRKISARHVTHPDWLQVECRLLIASKCWHEALHLSRAQLRIAPDRPHAWINQAYCLHELNRTRDALDQLLPAARKFPRHDLISFNLACYCCHLARFSDALYWVRRTIRLVNAS